MRIVEIMNKNVKQLENDKSHYRQRHWSIVHQLATRHWCRLSTESITLINDYLSVDGILVNDTDIS